MYNMFLLRTVIYIYIYISYIYIILRIHFGSNTFRFIFFVSMEEHDDVWSDVDDDDDDIAGDIAGDPAPPAPARPAHGQGLDMETFMR